jgi:hypothetical protein
MAGEFAEDGGIMARFRRKHFTIPIKKKLVIPRPILQTANSGTAAVRTDPQQHQIEEIPIPPPPANTPTTESFQSLPLIPATPKNQPRINQVVNQE